MAVTVMSFEGKVKCNFPTWTMTAYPPSQMYTNRSTHPFKLLPVTKLCLYGGPIDERVHFDILWIIPTHNFCN